jgi:hypothetical protein
MNADQEKAKVYRKGRREEQNMEKIEKAKTLPRINTDDTDRNQVWG